MFPNLQNSIILFLLFLNSLSLEIIIFVMSDLYVTQHRERMPQDGAFLCSPGIIQGDMNNFR